MKIHLLVALVGLSISFAVPTFAQQTNTPDPQIPSSVISLGMPMHLVSSMRSGMKADEAFNKNDAGAVAALFTEDAVLVASDGTDYRCFTKDCFQDKRAVRYAT
jgi:hypothetical protein